MKRFGFAPNLVGGMPPRVIMGAIGKAGYKGRLQRHECVGLCGDGIVKDGK